jgi:hypothetical protein
VSAGQLTGAVGDQSQQPADAAAIASPDQVRAAVLRMLQASDPSAADSPQRLAEAVATVTETLTWFAGRHPGSAPLDPPALGRLANYALDPRGQGWADAAGLLSSDSCGYPVAGGLYDVQGDVAASPLARANPGAAEAVMDQLRAEWADDYITTGSANLERSWQEYLRDAVAQPGG